MNPYKSHLFICTNSPGKDGKCGSKNSEQLRSVVKARCKEQSWAKEVRINTAGCLGHCEHGIAAVLYPEGKWFLELKDNDDEKLFNAVKKSVEKHR